MTNASTMSVAIPHHCNELQAFISLLIIHHPELVLPPG